MIISFARTTPGCVVELQRNSKLKWAISWPAEDPGILARVAKRAFRDECCHAPAGCQFAAYECFRVIRVAQIASGRRCESGNKLPTEKLLALLTAEAGQVIAAVSAEDQQSAGPQESAELLKPVPLRFCRHMRKDRKSIDRIEALTGETRRRLCGIHRHRREREVVLAPLNQFGIQIRAA